MYPLFLDLTGRRVVVVGGGCVATRRARGLVEAGAAVEVIAPEITDGLRGLVASGAVAWTAREYRSGDLMDPDPAWVAHTATGVREVDALVSWEAAAGRIWCVNAADRDRSTAWTPAVARGTAEADGITVAVTAGGDPRRAVALRDAIAGQLDAGGLPVRPFRSDLGLASVVR